MTLHNVSNPHRQTLQSITHAHAGHGASPCTTKANLTMQSERCTPNGNAPQQHGGSAARQRPPQGRSAAQVQLSFCPAMKYFHCRQRTRPIGPASALALANAACPRTWARPVHVPYIPRPGRPSLSRTPAHPAGLACALACAWPARRFSSPADATFC
jgi:hypothetical protein